MAALAARSGQSRAAAELKSGVNRKVSNNAEKKSVELSAIVFFCLFYKMSLNMTRKFINSHV